MGGSPGTDSQYTFCPSAAGPLRAIGPAMATGVPPSFGTTHTLAADRLEPSMGVASVEMATK